MTTDVETPIQTYTISGNGPYALPWPYDAGSIRAVLVDGGLETVLSGAQFGISPASSNSGGNLTLKGTTAADHAGEILRITRETPIEQGWAAERGARETAMEVSLDTLARGVQDALARDKALRIDISTLSALNGYKEALDAVATAAGLTVLELTGNGTTTAYTLPVAPASKAAVEVVVEGATQIQRDFTLSGAVLTLSEPVPAGVRFDIKIRVEFPYGWVAADNVQLQDGTMLGSTHYTFFTRADFVAAAPGLRPADGAICEAGGLSYFYEDGTNFISDLPGWLPTGLIMPEHWGADYTGTMSASPAITAAINYLSAIGGGQLVFWAGTYLIGSKITMKSNVELLGIGEPKLLRGVNGGPMIAIDDGNYGGLSYCSVTGFKIDGRNDTYTSGSCIAVRGSWNRVTNNLIENSPGHGINLSGFLGGTYTASGTTVTIVLDDDWSLTVGQSVHLQFGGAVPDGDYTVASVISSTTFTVTTGSSYSGSDSCALTTVDTVDNLIEGNSIRNCDLIGVSQHTAPRNTIRRNRIQNCGNEGITIDNESFRCLCDGNWIVNCGGSGGIGTDSNDMSRIVNNYIDMTDAPSGKPCIALNNNAGNTDFIVIANNVLIGSTIAAIWLKHVASPVVGEAGYWTSSGVTIQGNVVLNCGKAVSIDSGCNDNSVHGNTGNNAASRIIENDGLRNDIQGQPAQWLLRHSVAVSNTTGDATDVTLPFDTEFQNSGNLTIASGIVTIPVDGIYMISAGVRLAPGSTTTGGMLKIIASSKSVAFQQSNWPAVPSSYDLSVSAAVSLSKGDTVRVDYQVSGAASKNSGLALQAFCNFFSGVRIG